MQSEDVGSFMQFFIGNTSADVAVKTFGSVVAAEYDVVHDEAVGSVIQDFKDVMSVPYEVTICGSDVVEL